MNVIVDGWKHERTVSVVLEFHRGNCITKHSNLDLSPTAVFENNRLQGQGQVFINVSYITLKFMSFLI